MPGQVALVGKAGGGGGIRKGGTLGNHLLRPGEAAADLVAVRRGARSGTEVAGQREAVETGHGLEFLGGDGAVRLGRQEVAGSRHGAMGDGSAASAGPIVAARRQPTGHALDHGVDCQRLLASREIGEGFAQEVGQHRIVRHDLGHEGRIAADRRRYRGRVDIEHTVGEAGPDPSIIGGGMAVVRLVGMQHHDLAAAAGPKGAAIVEGLSAPKGQADAIGLVAMGVVGMAAETRRQALNTRAWFVEADEVVHHAQTFKTSPVSMPDMGCMIYDTKTALILRTDLEAWQVANVAAFLAGGLMAGNPEMAGEPYVDGAGRFYSALVREPVLVYGASLDELRRTHQRALSRALRPAIYIDAMFKTTNDADNRAAVAAADAEALDFVGIGVHGPRKVIDKVVNKLKFLG